MTTGKKIITIVGVTGNQGSSVASVFLGEPEWTVRGISRDPLKPASKAWIEKGVEVIAGNLDSVPSIAHAVHGSHVVFGNTDFWTHYSNPSTHARAAAEGRAANVVAYDLEVAQGKKMIDAVATTTTATLDRFILSTLSDTRGISRGKFMNNFHFDAKWQQVVYLRDTYPALWQKTSLLQLGIFASNWKMPGAHAPVKQKDGTFKVSMAIGGDVKFPMVDANADTGQLVKALVEVAPGKHLIGAGSYLSWIEWCEIWSKVNGVTCTFERTDRKVIEDAMGPVGVEFADMLQYIDEFGYDGGDPTVIYPWDLDVDVNVTTAEEYVKRQDWSSIL
ncbi:NAD(P)-binding protein [Pleomassaria siparia CBS 279.74]|uniref:NAD(P)-binding protein n=1 Tax=Pleomassaria siparia CBS 279.74 TaxID=1314801 RepID=A0A6G1KQQ9_9PLEO|nr:NAD(P)-binding protein [Pleomassaria siparia CBS 279.74]